MLSHFDQLLSSDLRQLFHSLDTPFKIQAYLDDIPYVSEELNRSPLRLMHDRQGHCLDGGIFAAAALRQLGYPPLILDLVPAPNADDDHVLALFTRNGLIGALAKSNFSGLRYREPIYRSLRELAMSYFEDFFNIKGEKSLRAYTRPINLSRFDRYDWMVSEAGVEQISRRLYSLKPIPLISPQSAAALSPVDRRAYEGGTVGTDFAGAFKPE